MFRTVLDTSGAVRVRAVLVLLPVVLARVVDLHGWALLLAHAVVVKVLAGLRCSKRIINKWNDTWRKVYYFAMYRGEVLSGFNCICQTSVYKLLTSTPPPQEYENGTR